MFKSAFFTVWTAIFSLFTCLISTNLSAQQDDVLLLSLEECVEIAIQNNLNIKRGALQKQSSKIDYDQARAARLPSVSLGASYGYNWGRSIDPTTNQFIAQQIGFNGVNGNASMVVFNWFRISNTVRQSQFLKEAATYDLDKTKNDIRLNVATFYLNVIFNRELLENANFQLETSKKQLERVTALVANGALPRSNELELISQVASNEVNVINAENNLNLAKLSLKQSMMLPARQEVNIVVPDFDIENQLDEIEPIQVVYEAALMQMPEIKSAELSMRSAEMGVKIAQAAFTPTLSLSGGFSTNYSDALAERRVEDPNGTPQLVPTGLQTASGEDILTFQNAFTTESYKLGDQYRDNLSKRLSLDLSIPVFNNLRTSSNYQKQKLALLQAEIDMQERRNTLRQEVESAHGDAKAASKTLDASQRQVDALEEAFRAVEKQYNLGASNFTDYQVASNNLFQAKSDLVRARFDYIFKTKILDFYQGEPLTF